MHSSVLTMPEKTTCIYSTVLDFIRGLEPSVVSKDFQGGNLA